MPESIGARSRFEMIILKAFIWPRGMILKALIWSDIEEVQTYLLLSTCRLGAIRAGAVCYPGTAIEGEAMLANGSVDIHKMACSISTRVRPPALTNRNLPSPASL